MSLFSLAGKVAIVTGSSRGIGRAIALRLAEHGARVVISSRKADACAAVRDEVNQAQGAGAAVAIPANISSKDELKHLVDETTRQLGRVDIVVCNAASNPYYGPLGGIEDDQFRKILENNVIANHWLINFAVPQMIERREGSIIIVSSIGGLRGSPVIGAYNVSKAADFQLARNLAVEYGPHNVRVNCIAPGLIKTDFARALWEDPETLQRRTASTPLRRIGEPDEIAGAAVFLASQAGAFMVLSRLPSLKCGINRSLAAFDRTNVTRAGNPLLAVGPIFMRSTSSFSTLSGTSRGSQARFVRAARNSCCSALSSIRMVASRVQNFHLIGLSIAKTPLVAERGHESCNNSARSTGLTRAALPARPGRNA